MHAWATTLLLVAAFVWCAGTWLRPARGARARLLPAVALAAGGALAFTGELLAADQRAHEAWIHATRAAAALGLALGEAPSPRVGLLLHALLPLAAALALAAPARTALAHARRHPGFALGGAALVATLALVAPLARGPRPFVETEMALPGWPFLWVHTLQGAIGSAALLAPALAVAAIAAALLAAPRVPLRARGFLLGGSVAAWAAISIVPFARAFA